LSIDGRILFNGHANVKGNQIDVSTLKPGFYILKVASNRLQFQSSFIKH